MSRKYPEFKEFKSRQELDDYENAREEYLFSRLKSKCGFFKFYMYLILDTIVPKYRRIIKDYERYEGGYWSDDNGYYWSTHPVSIFPQDLFDTGDIFVHVSGFDPSMIIAIYVFNDQGTCRISPDELGVW